MTDPIRFKTTEDATLVTALANGRQHDTTDEELDALVRDRGYKIISDREIEMLVEYSDIKRQLAEANQRIENQASEIEVARRQVVEAKEENEVRKILAKERSDSCAELSGMVADLKLKLAAANEQIQTLGLMHAQEQAKNKSLQIEVNQLRGELQHPIPEKWRKAIEYVAKRHGCFIVDTPVGKFASIATDSLNGIAAELEKESSNESF